MDRSSFDNQMFTWENYAEDPDCPTAMQFKNVVLTVPVGPFEVGTKFPYAVIVGELSLLILIDENDNQRGFDLKLSVGEEVQPLEAEACEAGCSHDHSQ
jgi:hypothetical protein